MPAKATWIALAKGARGYPPGVAHVRDAPENLYVLGSLPAETPVVAIVGARAASGHGTARAREIAVELCRAGALVISGGAIGIDSAAHAGALAAGSPTVAVVAPPESSDAAPYPARSRPLYDAIVDAGGALVTPFAPGTPLRRWHFPRRNRVIAALADAVVVIEASPRSGSFSTAAAAIEYGKILGACPGSPGTDALLAQGACAVDRADDVLAALAGRPRHRDRAPLPASDTDEAVALACVDEDLPRGVDAVAALAGFGAARAARALLALELAGHVLAVPGGRYVRSGPSFSGASENPSIRSGRQSRPSLDDGAAPRTGGFQTRSSIGTGDR